MKNLKNINNCLAATLGIAIFSWIGCQTQSALAIDVRTSGNVIKNLSNQQACDVNIGFRIPGLFEKILGGNINIKGLDPIAIVNEGLSSFDQDIFFIKNGKFLCFDPSEPIFVDILVNSKKKNAIKWLTEKVFLTGAGGKNNPLQSELGLAGFVVENKVSNTRSLNRDI
ncbi:PEP-CTERM sorting domain-containing protein, partial (plasmid) [Trichormus variabilis V5]|nr:PEP-CTERM sorting domain-containing protein [Trichormus variabilis V5]